MAFLDRSRDTYVSILKGKFCIRSNQDNPKAVPRILEKGINAGKTVYEVFHDSFMGKLVDIKTKDSADYGKSWIFTFLDVPTGELFHLNLSYSNSYAKSLLKMLPNVDLANEFKLSPSLKMVDGKEQSSLFINQNEKTIKHAFTKDNPNGMPNFEKIIVKGKEIWDDSKQLAFFEHMVNKHIIPNLDNAAPLAVTSFAPVGNTFADFGDTTPDSNDPGF